jgi:hypothetical protein
MEMPQMNSSTETHLDTFGEFHLSALKAEPEAADIATEFEGTQTTLRTTFDARKDADRVVVQVEALVYRGESDLEAAIKQVEGRVLLFINKNRKAEPYVTAFPNGLGGALAPKGKAQSTEARRIVASLGPATGVPADVTALLPEVLRLATALDDRCDALDAAEKAALAALALERTELRRWRDQYRKDHGLLTALWPSDKKRVETFFKSAKRKKKPDTRRGGGEGGS